MSAPQRSGSQRSGERVHHALNTGDWCKAFCIASGAQRRIEGRILKNSQPGWRINPYIGQAFSQLQGRHRRSTGEQPGVTGLGSRVSLSFYAGLNQQRDAGRYCESNANKRQKAWRLAHNCKCRTTSTHKLGEVQQQIDVPVQPLAFEVVPVPILHIKHQIVMAGRVGVGHLASELGVSPLEDVEAAFVAAPATFRAMVRTCSLPSVVGTPKDNATLKGVKRRVTAGETAPHSKGGTA